MLWFDDDMPDVAFVDPNFLTDVLSNFVSTKLDRTAPDCGRFRQVEVELTLQCFFPQDGVARACLDFFLKMGLMLVVPCNPPLLIVPGLLSAQIGADAAEIKRGRKVVVALNFVGGGLPLDASNRVLTRLSRSAHAIWHQALLFGAPDGAPDGGVVVEMAAEAVRITAASVESFGAARRAGDEIERLLWGHFRGLGYRIDVELGDDTKFVRRNPDELLQALRSNPAATVRVVSEGRVRNWRVEPFVWRLPWEDAALRAMRGGGGGGGAGPCGPDRQGADV